MSNRIEKTNLLTTLNIRYDNILETLNSLTDEQVDEAYFDRLVELYIDINKQYLHKSQFITEYDKMPEVIEERIRNQFSYLLKGLSLKAKIAILENKVLEYGITKLEQKNIELYLGIFRDAYDTLKSKEDRKKYISTLGSYTQTNEALENLLNRMNDLAHTIKAGMVTEKITKLKTIDIRKTRN